MASARDGLTPKQSALLEQFKQSVQDVLQSADDDFYLLRWLRARAWDLKKSEKMLRESKAWRQSFGADSLVDWKVPEVLQRYFPGGYFGNDKEGYPTWIDRFGPVDLKGMLFCVKRSDIVKFRIRGTEVLYQKMLPDLSKKFNKRIDGCNLLFDMEGIGLKHLWKPALETFIEMLKLLEANYPETLRVCYIVNAPRIFPIAYNLVKPFLSEDTKKKIRVLGSDFKSQLLKVYPADQLPVAYGGSAQLPDPYCTQFVCAGGVIPKDCYKLKPEVDTSKFTLATVERGGVLQVETEVTQEADVLSWQFWTEGTDIGFGVYRINKSQSRKVEEMDEVIGLSRVDSHIIPEDGSVTCEQTGTYVLHFDNTYSWLKSKKISYSVEVFEPDTTLLTTAL